VAQLEIRTNPDGLLGEPLATGLRGAEGGIASWKARLRDDDGRIWRCNGRTAAELGTDWAPAKQSSGTVAAARSLRPLEIELRAELPDGRSTTRTIKRRLLTDGVKVRRWRGEHATLYIPATTPKLTLLITGSDAWLAPAAALLASQGAIVLLAAPAAEITALTEKLASATAAGSVERIEPPPPPPGFPSLINTSSPDPWPALRARLA
jgi:hypothetical protein